MSVSDRPLNSPIQIPIARDTPPGLPNNLVGVFDDIFNALYLLQVAFVNYAGVASQDASAWSQLSPDQTILQSNMNRIYLPAEDTMGFAAVASLHSNGGICSARYANAANNTRVASLFCNTTSGVAAGGYAEFIVMQGLLTGLSGLTPGTIYYLSEVNGTITSVKPVGAGKIVQVVGIALSTSILYFCPELQFLQL